MTAAAELQRRNSARLDDAVGTQQKQEFLLDDIQYLFNLDMQE